MAQRGDDRLTPDQRQCDGEEGKGKRRHIRASVCGRGGSKTSTGDKTIAVQPTYVRTGIALRQTPRRNAGQTPTPWRIERNALNRRCSEGQLAFSHNSSRLTRCRGEAAARLYKTPVHENTTSASPIGHIPSITLSNVRNPKMAAAAPAIRLNAANHHFCR